MDNEGVFVDNFRYSRDRLRRAALCGLFSFIGLVLYGYG
jgi:hypothetical protein